MLYSELFFRLIFILLVPSNFALAKEPVLYLPKKGRAVLFSWEDQGRWKRYILSISSSPEFLKSDTLEVRVDRSSIERIMKKEGKYFWKVEMRNKERTLVSPVKSFVLKKPPKLKAPKVNSVGRHQFSKEAPKMLTWQSFNRASEYLLEVYSWESKKLFLRKTIPVAKHVFDDLRHAEEGYYFIRVAAVDRWGWTGRFSECRWTWVGNREDIGEIPSWAGEDVCIDR